MSRPISIRHLVLLPVLLLAVAAMSPQAFAAGDLTRDDWVEATTAHFRVIGDAGRRTTRELASKLEVFCALLERQGYPVPGEDAPTTVVALRDQEDLPVFGAPVADLSCRCVGYAVAGPSSGDIVVHARARREDVLDSAFRAYLQLVLGRGERPWPVWFRIGMGEYYRTFAVQRDTISFARPIPDYVQILRSAPLLPLDELFAVDEAALRAMGPRESARFTAESWLVVHYLFASGGQRRLQARGFLKGLADGRQIEAAFDDALGRSFAELESELLEYLDRRRLPYQRIEDVGIARRPQPELSDLSPEAVLSEQRRLADLRAQDVGRRLMAILATPEPSEAHEYPLRRVGVSAGLGGR